jgi:hypothetical protein
VPQPQAHKPLADTANVVDRWEEFVRNCNGYPSAIMAYSHNLIEITMMIKYQIYYQTPDCLILYCSSHPDDFIHFGNFAKKPVVEKVSLVVAINTMCKE